MLVKNKKIILLMVVIQLGVLGVIGLELVGIKIQGLRFFLGFVYLTFVPGFLILEVLKVKETNLVINLLYAVGLSLTFLMFFGLLLNNVLPFFGITRPISSFPVIVSISVVVIFLICYMVFKFHNKDQLNLVRFSGKTMKNRAKVYILYLLYPFLSILGTVLINRSGENWILIVLIPLIALGFIAPLLFKNIISSDSYFFIVFVISIALLLHQVLVSSGIRGGDIQLEYYAGYLVKKNGFWNTSNFMVNSNTVLSVTILPVIYSIVLGVDELWVFKIIYPFIFSLVPVGLYYVYKLQFGKTSAFLASFFVVSTSTFYILLPTLSKQMVSEFFILLLLLLIVFSKDMSMVNRKILMLFFCGGLCVSHYTLSYYFLFLGILFLGIKFILKKRVVSNFDGLNNRYITVNTFLTGNSIGFFWC